MSWLYSIVLVHSVCVLETNTGVAFKLYLCFTMINQTRHYNLKKKQYWSDKPMKFIPIAVSRGKIVGFMAWERVALSKVLPSLRVNNIGLSVFIWVFHLSPVNFFDNLELKIFSGKHWMRSKGMFSYFKKYQKFINCGNGSSVFASCSVIATFMWFLDLSGNDSMWYSRLFSKVI